jgi:hypothetical protein
MIYLQDHMVIASFVKPKPSSAFNVWFINLKPVRLKDVRCCLIAYLEEGPLSSKLKLYMLLKKFNIDLVQVK